MDPDLLRTFLAVARRRSFSRAAEDLVLSQPAVSRRVERLERAIGVRLILRLGASTTPGFYLLPRVLGRFHARFPGVEIRYAVENSSRVEGRLLANELDLGFVGAPLRNPELRQEPLVRDRIVCFASPRHPLASRRVVRPRDLAGRTWVVREPGSATRRVFEEWLSGVGVRLEKTVELQCPEALKALVLSGYGISFMSEHGVREEARRGRARILPVAGCRVRRTICVARHADKHLSAPMREFLAEARRAYPRRDPAPG